MRKPGSLWEIIDMFAMRKSDKQVRDKEARIPRSSPSRDSQVTGEMFGGRPAAPLTGARRETAATNEALQSKERETRCCRGVIFR